MPLQSNRWKAAYPKLNVVKWDSFAQVERTATNGVLHTFGLRRQSGLAI